MKRLARRRPILKLLRVALRAHVQIDQINARLAIIESDLDSDTHGSLAQAIGDQSDMHADLAALVAEWIDVSTTRGAEPQRGR